MSIRGYLLSGNKRTANYLTQVSWCRTVQQYAPAQPHQHDGMWGRVNTCYTCIHLQPSKPDVWLGHGSGILIHSVANMRHIEHKCSRQNKFKAEEFLHQVDHYHYDAETAIFHVSYAIPLLQLLCYLASPSHQQWYCFICRINWSLSSTIHIRINCPVTALRKLKYVYIYMYLQLLKILDKTRDCESSCAKRCWIWWSIFNR